MTVIRPNAIAGITSLTAQTDTINFFTSTGTLAGLVIGGANLNASSGVSTVNVIKVGAAQTLDASGLNITGVITATSFRGDGSNLTGVAATSNIRTNAIVNSGVTTVSAGTTAIPSISPDGDPNTGIFFPSADTIAIAEGGVEALRIDSSGRIGIGTTGPTHLLELRTVSSNIFKIVANSEGGVPLIVAANANTVTPTNQFFVAHNLEEVNIGNARSAALTLHTGNTERLRITSSGNVGVGLTTPTSKLQVSGDVSISGVGTATEFVSTSDVTLKENIMVIDNPITKLSELRGVTFDWKKGGSSVGVIAQDVEKVLPQAVRGEENNKAVNYNGIIGLLVESIKQQQKEIDELKSRLDK